MAFFAVPNHKNTSYWLTTSPSVLCILGDDILTDKHAHLPNPRSSEDFGRLLKHLPDLLTQMTEAEGNEFMSSENEQI